MMLRTSAAGLIIIAAACIAALAQGQAPSSADSLKVLDFVPPDASIAVVVPSLKATSNDLTTCLEGMERATMLLGGRPVDQMRALLGLQAGVDEGGSAAVIYGPDGFDAPPLFIVPVTNSSDFIDTNLDPLPDESGRTDLHRHASGTPLYVRALDRHVIMSEQAAAVDGWMKAEGAGAAMGARLPERAASRVATADFLVMLRGEATRRLARKVRAAGGGGGAPGPFDPLAFIPNGLLEAGPDTVLAIDVDPLGLGVHAFTAVESESDLGRALGGVGASGPLFDRLPAKVFYVAASIDLRGSNVKGMIDAFTGGSFVTPRLLEAAHSAQVLVAPSPMGLQGGLLNDAAIVFSGEDPAALQGALRELFESMAFEDATTRVIVKWQDGAREIGGVPVAAYEVQYAPPADEIAAQMTHTLLFGRGGFRGFVGAFGESVVVTFSQRPDVFTAAVEAARGGESLASDPVLTGMRRWMPEEPDAAVFIGVGAFGRILSQVAAAFGDQLPMPVSLPEIDPECKPVGWAVDLTPGAVEWSLVVPADVLSLLVDAVVQQMLQMDDVMTQDDRP
jgi:hypothetical protein